VPTLEITTLVNADIEALSLAQNRLAMRFASLGMSQRQKVKRVLSLLDTLAK
jgi:replicative DNA helicase